MILDLPRFVETERPHWAALEKTLVWLEMNPGGRLTLEEAARFQALYKRAQQGQQLTGRKATFSAQLMTHNTQVSLTALAFGMSFGLGMVILLFYNGLLLGAVAIDYVAGGQTIFLLGWLLPHGVIEIPAILIGGQAGLVIAHALIGWGDRSSRAERLRHISRDVVTLAGGVAIMLVWAGLVEAFVSQYHEPVLPYGLKIAFGLIEALLLTTVSCTLRPVAGVTRCALKLF